MTDEVSAYLDEKLIAIEKILSDPDDSTIRWDVELAQTRDQRAPVFRAEVNIFLNGETLRAESTGETMNAAIDGVKNEMQRQLRKVKSKNSSFLRRGGSQIKKFLKFGREE